MSVHPLSTTPQGSVAPPTPKLRAQAAEFTPGASLPGIAGESLTATFPPGDFSVTNDFGNTKFDAVSEYNTGSDYYAAADNSPSAFTSGSYQHPSVAERSDWGHSDQLIGGGYAGDVSSRSVPGRLSPTAVEFAPAGGDNGPMITQDLQQFSSAPEFVPASLVSKKETGLGKLSPSAPEFTPATAAATTVSKKALSPSAAAFMPRDAFSGQLPEESEGNLSANAPVFTPQASLMPVQAQTCGPQPTPSAHGRRAAPPPPPGYLAPSLPSSNDLTKPLPRSDVSNFGRGISAGLTTMSLNNEWEPSLYNTTASKGSSWKGLGEDAERDLDNGHHSEWRDGQNRSDRQYESHSSWSGSNRHRNKDAWRDDGWSDDKWKGDGWNDSDQRWSKDGRQRERGRARDWHHSGWSTGQAEWHSEEWTQGGPGYANDARPPLRRRDISPSSSSSGEPTGWSRHGQVEKLPARRPVESPSSSDSEADYRRPRLRQSDAPRKLLRVEDPPREAAPCSSSEVMNQADGTTLEEEQQSALPAQKPSERINKQAFHKFALGHLMGKKPPRDRAKGREDTTALPDARSAEQTVVLDGAAHHVVVKERIDDDNRDYHDNHGSVDVANVCQEHVRQSPADTQLAPTTEVPEGRDEERTGACFDSGGIAEDSHSRAWCDLSADYSFAGDVSSSSPRDLDVLRIPATQTAVGEARHHREAEPSFRSEPCHHSAKPELASDAALAKVSMPVEELETTVPHSEASSQH